jgi:hypothetical protein
VSKRKKTTTKPDQVKRPRKKRVQTTEKRPDKNPDKPQTPPKLDIKLLQIAALAGDPDTTDVELANLAIGNELERVLGAVQLLNILKVSRPIVFRILIRFYFETIILNSERFRSLVEDPESSDEEVLAEIYGFLPNLIDAANALMAARPNIFRALNALMELLAKTEGTQGKTSG